MYHHAKAFVSVSRYLAGSVAAVTGRTDARIIPNVVDTTIFYPKAEKYARFTFVHVSNMDPVKNVKEILEAFALALTRSGDQNMQLVIVGNRNDHYVLMAHEMGLLNRQVFFRGELPYREVAAEVRMSHCAVLFSQSETFSCVAAESLCAGLPVIASNTGALPERLEGGAGILVEPGNIEGLALAMMEVKEGYTGFKANEIGLAAAAIYGYPAVSEAFNQLYSEVCTAETTPD
jgi:glycosyltransferase involved in cell wall biosynthesis